MNRTLLVSAVVAAVSMSLFALERLFPSRVTDESLVGRLLVNFTIAVLSFTAASTLVQPAAGWALRWSAEKPFGLLHVTGASGWTFSIYQSRSRQTWASTTAICGYRSHLSA